MRNTTFSDLPFGVANVCWMAGGAMLYAATTSALVGVTCAAPGMSLMRSLTFEMTLLAVANVAWLVWSCLVVNAST